MINGSNWLNLDKNLHTGWVVWWREWDLFQTIKNNWQLDSEWIRELLNSMEWHVYTKEEIMELLNNDSIKKATLRWKNVTLFFDNWIFNINVNFWEEIELDKSDGVNLEFWGIVERSTTIYPNTVLLFSISTRNGIEMVLKNWLHICLWLNSDSLEKITQILREKWCEEIGWSIYCNQYVKNKLLENGIEKILK